MKIEIKPIFGSVLFEYTKENNTFRDTILEAIKQKANLCYANLRYANLRYANLSSADLSSAKKENSILPIYCKWGVNYSSDFKTIHIGCKSNTIKDWDKWFKGSEVFETSRDTEEFKLIQANYEAVKSFCKTMLK